MSDKLDKIIETKKLLLPILTEVQDKYGYISESLVRQLSKKTKIPMAEIYGVATFYSFFSTKPQGKNIIHICNSPSCYLNGSLDLIKFLEKELGIKSGETTDDKRFSLHIGSCIGCCDKAPAMLVNGKLYSDLTEKKLREIIKKCRS
ncbi:MAG: NADH-quinone oxidoreductase subunit NuoE [Nanoarchaeota archaeon]|nr:NADH-quinone oxidoreductase subunit NuoE [Nanoarchaeota archaeon]